MLENREQEVRSYVASKGWNVVGERGGELWIGDCPFCGARGRSPMDAKFSIKLRTSVYKCFKASCEAANGGNLYTLKRAMGDAALPMQHASTMSVKDERELEYERKLKAALTNSKLRESVDEMHAALLADFDTFELVRQWRGFTTETVFRYKLGIQVRNGERWLSIPAFVDGLPVFVKYRSIDGIKRFDREAGCPSVLFGIDDVSAGAGSSAYLCEGEIDAITLTQLGFSPAVSVTAGAGSFAQRWRDALESFDRVYLLYDNDDQGEKGVELVSKELGSWRCARVTLPHKDANECLQKMGPESARDAIQGACQRATPLGSSGIIHVSDAVERLLASEAPTDPGSSSGWDVVDTQIGGIRKEFIVVSGDTGTGKTTWTTALLMNLVKAGERGLIVSPEMTVEQLGVKVSSMTACKSFYRMTHDERMEALAATSKLPLWVVDQTGDVELDRVRHTVEAFRRKHRGDVVVLDHLDFFVDTAERAELESAFKDMSQWPKRYGIKLILVVHPTKLRVSGKTGKTQRVGLNDLYGSRIIKQLAMTVVLLHRVGPFSVDVEDAKVRYDGPRLHGPVRLDFDPDTFVYTRAKREASTTKGDGRAAAAGETGDYLDGLADEVSGEQDVDIWDRG